MAVFYNQANLSYSGGNTNSNIVSGEILEVLGVSKTAVIDEYATGDVVTYIVSIINSGNTAFSDVTVTDNLGAYNVGTTTIIPLDYVEGSIKYYRNGTLVAPPTVTDTEPLVFTDISVPANGNAMLIYSTAVRNTANPQAGGEITNAVTVSGTGIANPITATETVNTADQPRLTISKSLNPAVITDNSVLTYTLTVQNLGNTAADAQDNIVISDNFDPVLSDITVLVNGDVVQEGEAYTYNEATGEFATIAGVITVPAATFAQNPVNGEWTVTPGVTTITVRGTV